MKKEGRGRKEERVRKVGWREEGERGRVVWWEEGERGRGER